MSEIDPARIELKKSFFLSKELAIHTIEESLEEIDGLVQNGIFRNPDMYIAVAIPVYKENYGFAFDVLADKKLGDVDNWQFEYQDFALPKIDFCARTGISVNKAYKKYPHLIHEQDGIYPGARCKKGIITACSSEEIGEPDEKVCKILMHNCYRLLKDAKSQYLGKISTEQHFFTRQDN